MIHVEGSSESCRVMAVALFLAEAKGSKAIMGWKPPCKKSMPALELTSLPYPSSSGVPKSIVTLCLDRS